MSSSTRSPPSELTLPKKILQHGHRDRKRDGKSGADRLSVDDNTDLRHSTNAMRKSASISLSFVFLLVMFTGCGDKMEAHLSKFMTDENSKPDFGPVPDAYSLAESEDVARRLAFMTFDEVAYRLGAHRWRSDVRFRFSTSEHYTSLKEQALIVQAANGDFRVKVDNDAEQGYELVFSGKNLWIKSRYGPFHARQTIDGVHLTQRNQAYGAWAAIFRLFRGELAFGKKGLTRHFGRDAIKYSISLARTKPSLPANRPQPKVPDGVTKYVYPVEPTLSEQHKWREHAKPQDAAGELVVDLETGVVLKVQFDGVLKWKNPSNQEVTLSVKANLEADGFGNPPSISPPDPKTVKPLPERIKVDTHPLDFFFGKGFTATLGPPAGVARKAKPDKKEDAEKDSAKTGGVPSNP